MKKFLFYLFLLNCVFYAQSHLKPVKDSLLLKEVVITGTKYENSRNNIPFTVSSISSEEINRTGEYNVLNVVQNSIPGIFVTEKSVLGFGTSTGSAGSIGIRGVRGGDANTNVLVMLDGSPQFMGIFGHPISDSYVSSDVERVEVIRGPASLLYGTNAMGGVINIITKKNHTQGWTANAGVSAGSYSTTKYTGSVGYRNDGFGIFAAYNSGKTDGIRSYSDFNIRNGYVKVDYQLSDALSLTTDYDLAVYKTNDPGPSNALSNSTMDITRGKYSASLSNKFENTEGALQLFSNYGKHDINDPAHFISTDRTSGAMLYQSIQVVPGGIVTLGTDYKVYGGTANMGAAANQKKSIAETAVYGYGQYTFSSLTSTAGIRYENNSVYKSIIVPMAGLAYSYAPNKTLKATISKGFRSPTMMELYLFAPNIDLKPEKMTNYEIGAMHEINLSKSFLSSIFESYSREITFFYSKGDNIIVTEGGWPFMSRKNSGAFINKGAELATKMKTKMDLDININYSYLFTDKVTLAAPKHMLNVDMIYGRGSVCGGVNVKYIDGLVISNAASVITETYATLNAFVSAKFMRNTEVLVSLNNILDRSYEINYGYPMAKRNFSAGVRFNY